MRTFPAEMLSARFGETHRSPFRGIRRVTYWDRMPEKTGMHERIVAAIRKVPRGQVSTYGSIAKAAGFPGAARQVVRALHQSAGLAWHRILGAGGEIKLRGEYAFEQRFRLESEGVTFRGRRVNMRLHEFKFRQTKQSRNSPKSKSK